MSLCIRRVNQQIYCTSNILYHQFKADNAIIIEVFLIVKTNLINPIHIGQINYVGKQNHVPLEECTIYIFYGA